VPDGAALEGCRKFGEQVAQRVRERAKA